MTKGEWASDGHVGATRETLAEELGLGLREYRLAQAGQAKMVKIEERNGDDEVIDLRAHSRPVGYTLEEAIAEFGGERARAGAAEIGVVLVIDFMDEAEIAAQVARLEEQIAGL